MVVGRNIGLGDLSINERGNKGDENLGFTIFAFLNISIDIVTLYGRRDFFDSWSETAI